MAHKCSHYAQETVRDSATWHLFWPLPTYSLFLELFQLSCSFRWRSCRSHWLGRSRDPRWKRWSTCCSTPGPTFSCTPCRSSCGRFFGRTSCRSTSGCTDCCGRTCSLGRCQRRLGECRAACGSHRQATCGHRNAGCRLKNSQLHQLPGSMGLKACSKGTNIVGQSK